MNMVLADTLGSRDRNNNWDGAMGLLQRSEGDMLPAARPLTLDNSDIVTPTFPLMNPSYQLYILPPTFHYNWNSIFNPLAFHFWLASIGTFFIIYLVLECIYNFGRKMDLRGGDILADKDESVGMYVLASITQQGILIVSSSVAFRTALLMCFILGFFLYEAYSEELMSSIALRNVELPFESLEELVDKRHYSLVVIEDDFVYTQLKSAEDGILHKVNKSLTIEHTKEDMVYLFKSLCNQSRKTLLTNYDLRWYAKEVCQILKIQKKYFTMPFYLLMRKNLPYAPNIFYTTQVMAEYGFIKSIMDSIFIEMKYEDIIPDVEVVRLSQLVAPFVFLAVAIVLSLAILPAEIIFWKMKQRRRRQRWPRLYNRPYSHLMPVRPFLH